MRALLLALPLLFTACDGPAGEACDDEGATRCMAEAAETCIGGEWTITDDCAANGASCFQQADMAEGEAHCM